MNGIVNRLSCATMNQLYSSKETHAFLKYMMDSAIDIYCVANNAVPCMDGTYNHPRTVANDAVEPFLELNGLETPTLKRLAYAYYFSMFDAPKKAFDLYSAMALVNRMKCIEMQASRFNILYCDDKYGIALISDERKHLYDAIYDYCTALGQEPSNNSEEELSILRKIDITTTIMISIPIFNINKDYVRGLANHPPSPPAIRPV
jgi:hypothetical protein